MDSELSVTQKSSPSSLSTIITPPEIELRTLHYHITIVGLNHFCTTMPSAGQFYL